MSIKDSRPLWPAEFEQLVQEIEKNPNDKTPWGVAADWLDEAERGETDLAEAFRWIHKRAGVEIEAATESYAIGEWRFKGKTLPSGVRDAINDYYKPDVTKGIDNHTLPGLAAKLAAGLRHLKEQMF